jgi:uncharacterized delta-60 repeat protein
VERLEDRRLLAAAGDLDATFDGDGIALFNFGGVSEGASSLALQADGKLVAAGWTGSAGGDMAAVRVNPDGSADTSFGGDGMASATIGSGYDRAYGTAIQSDGKIVVAGLAEVPNRDFALARFNTDGSLDTSFSGDGMLTTTVGADWDEINSVAIQADGKIVAAGYTDTGIYDMWAIARYQTNGTLDPSFDGDGIRVMGFGGINDRAADIAIQPDGKIVVVGRSTSNFGVVRLLANGSLDTSFSGDGIQSTDFGGVDEAKAVALQADGKLVVVGTSWITGGPAGYDVAVARYNVDGSLDAAGFTGTGKLSRAIGTSNDVATDVAMLANGKILVAGRTRNGSVNDFFLMRLDSFGFLDTRFGGDGIVTTPITGLDDLNASLVVQADGKYAVSGYHSTGTGHGFALARYEWNNSPTNPGNVALTAINEDAPAGSITGSTVSSLVTSSGSTDADGHSRGIAITAADNANGQWQYSTNGGGAWQNLTALSGTAARLLAPSHRVRFVPNANFDSTTGPAPAIGFKTWDQTNGTAGTTGDTSTNAAFSTAAAQATQPVTAINDEQVLATNMGMSSVRGGTAAIGPMQLETTDVDDAPAGLVYTITSGPAHGTIRVGGTPVGQFTQQDVAAGNVSYAHDGSASVADSFDFTVDDGEGTSSAGTFNIEVAMAGDYNRDQVVNAADYLRWRKQLGATGVPAYSGADGDGNTAVEQADYGVWTAHFGESFGSGSGSQSLPGQLSVSEKLPHVAAPLGAADLTPQRSSADMQRSGEAEQGDSRLRIADVAWPVVENRGSRVEGRAARNTATSYWRWRDDALLAWAAARRDAQLEKFLTDGGLIRNNDRAATDDAFAALDAKLKPLRLQWQ